MLLLKPIVNQGYINPELKRVLNGTLDSAYFDILLTKQKRMEMMQAI